MAIYRGVSSTAEPIVDAVHWSTILTNAFCHTLHPSIRIVIGIIKRDERFLAQRIYISFFSFGSRLLAHRDNSVAQPYPVDEDIPP